MNNEQALSLQDSGVRRRVQNVKSWFRWLLDHTFHVRRNDGATDKTAMAWRTFQTSMLLGLLGLGTAIWNHVATGGYLDGSQPQLQRIEKRLSDVEEKVDENTRRLRYVTRFVDGLDDTHANTKANK